MTRLKLTLACVLAAFFLIAADGCGSNPNVEGAKLDLRNKDYGRALENVNKALEADPDNVEALFLKGDIVSEMLPEVTDIHERAVYIREVVAAYRRGVELDPAWPVQVQLRLHSLYLLEFNKGIEVYSEAEQSPGQDRVNAFIESAVHFRNATVIFPDSGDAYINEAAAYYGAGMMGEAIEVYETALSLGHTDREVYIYMAKTYEILAEEWATVDDRAGYYGQMVEVLEQGANQYPDDDELRAMLLNAYVYAEQPKQALMVYQRELSTERSNKVFLYNYGTLMLHEADYDGAIAMLSDAVLLDSTYVNARFNLGAAYINKAVAVDEDYRAVDDTLHSQRDRLPASRRARMESRMQELGANRQALFEKAIEHLEAARLLVENQQGLGEASDICKALFRAYAQTDQNEKAEALSNCTADQQGP